MKKKVYYAHSMALYNTPQEQRDIQTLLDLGFAVYNPNNPIVASQCERHKKEDGDYMEKIFGPLILDCKALAFRAFGDGKIGAGVMKEIKMADEYGIPIFELPSAISERGLSVAVTRERLSELGQR